MVGNLETSKKESSGRQIRVAIEAFMVGNLDCAITLAGAAENILPPTNEPHLFLQLQPYHAELDINLVINWLKHPTGPETATITAFEAAFVIARAISKFIAVYHQATMRMHEFLTLAVEEGHLPAFFAAITTPPSGSPDPSEQPA